MPKTNQRGLMDLNKLTQHLGAIYRNTVSNLYDKTGFEDDAEVDEFGMRKGGKVAGAGRKVARPSGKGRTSSVTPVPSSSVKKDMGGVGQRKASQDVRMTTEATTALSPYMSRRLETSTMKDSQRVIT